MCGIVGIHDLHSDRDMRPDVLGRMMGAIRHRGPDEAGLYLDDAIGLGATWIGHGLRVPPDGRADNGLAQNGAVSEKGNGPRADRGRRLRAIRAGSR